MAVACRLSVRGRETGAREPQEIPQIRPGRRDRVARRYRGEPGAVRGVHQSLRGGRPGRPARAVARGKPRDLAGHDVLRDATQPGAGLLQPDSDPAARRQPRLLPSAAPRLGSQVPAVLRAWHAPAPPDSLARPRGHQCLPVAGRPADESGPCRRRGTPDRGGLVTALPPTAQDQAGFVVELEQFSGPLDLLLHLIREDEVDITDLPIAKIADQFLAVINELRLNQAADYLEMAARLLRIKAQMLLPRHVGDDEWEDPRAELVRRVLEYQQIRELVEWLGAAAARRAEQFGRGFSPEPPTVPPAPLVIDLNDLLAAAERVIALIPEPVLHRVVPRPLDVEGATARIEALLAERAALGWGDVVGERPTIVDVLSAFIALLELAKRGALRVHQEGPFAPIQIRRESPREAR
ncbi:MAG: hypothetical protein DMD27_15360 [Gemmatimonadetes bacterium]|nr:MAG: hypothetical protein DMD27_15360 [Gemmatimonadota bacterium]PYP11645.1 MAG: hypothetical protein DMD56_06155 [Gemmatimonadota bacterium]